MSFTSAVAVAGVVMRWGTTQINALSLQVSYGAEGEIDMTGINAAAVVTDPLNSQHKLVAKSVDYSIIDIGELSCEYLGPGQFNTTLIGSKRPLTITIAGSTAFSWISQAFLTRNDHQMQAGDLVRGSCTFRFSRF